MQAGKVRLSEESANPCIPQINDLTELHQNEMESLKACMSDMEEKVHYQSEERQRDFHEMLDSCGTRVSGGGVLLLTAWYGGYNSVIIAKFNVLKEFRIRRGARLNIGIFMYPKESTEGAWERRIRIRYIPEIVPNKIKHKEFRGAN